jgi:murein DD-endopeptidase MepM/ murein hydrolase activator NlpD
MIAERETLRKAFEEELFQYESTLKVILNPKSFPAKGSAPLSWPMKDVLVTQLYRATSGPHAGTEFGHTGVDFRGNGDPVYAMADGVVGGIGDTDASCAGASFGKWIFVRFDNNLSAVYAHLSIISVTSGQKVTRGQLLGYSGGTGRVTAPHLHITLYADIDANGKNIVHVEGKESLACRGKILTQPRAPREAYLNPLDYLPPLTAAMKKVGL